MEPEMTLSATDTAFDYEEFLREGGAGWRRRILLLGLLGVLIAAGLLTWFFAFRGGGGEAVVDSTTAAVSRGTITTTVSTTGTVASRQTSELSFEQSGKVTKVNVTLGQQVKAGDVLAEVDPTDAQRALDTAQVGLQVAQAKLQDLLDGATAAELASAEQSVTQAQSNYDEAVRAMNDLLAPPTALELAAIQQDVTNAQAKLQQAREARTGLDQDAADAVAAAQDALGQAEEALDQAESDVANAESETNSAKATLYTAEDSYCAIDGSPSFCSGNDAPLSSSDEAALVSAADTGPPAEAQAATKVLNANTSYRGALSGQQAAQNARDDAEAAVADAQDALNKAEAAPSAGDVASADAAVGAAQLAVDTANDALATLQAGPLQQDIEKAQGAIDAAAGSLASAMAKRDETYAGPLAADILQQQETVKQRQDAVDQAREDLGLTKLVAPYDGTIAGVNVQAGDTAGGGGATSTSAASSSNADIVLNTPDALILNLTISESDYNSVKAGQSGIATFDAIADGGIFPIVIESIGSTGATTQGVVTYQATARLITDLPSGAPGQDGGFRGRRAADEEEGSPQASGTPARTPGASRTPAATPTRGVGGPSSPPTSGTATTAAAARPAVGMNATITITTQRVDDVLMVPSRAVQEEGRSSYVDLQAEDGTVSRVTVTTGLAGDSNTEITSGLEEGQTVVVPGASPTGGTSTGETGQPPGFGEGGLPDGDFGGGGGPGGGH
jgi:HlyD family secretion protein